MITYFVDNFWLGPLLWSILYISDYSFTIACAKMYRQQSIIVFEGSFELNPIFQKDIDSLKIVSSRFLLILVIGIGILLFIWFLNSTISDWNLYLFALGSFIFGELVIHKRHLQNWFLYRYAIGSNGIQGHIEYSRKIILRRSALEMFLFTILLFIVFALTFQWFFLGGTCGCLSNAINQYRLALKK